MIDVVIPQMGESITEGTLTRWLKKPGEKIERDEPLFEISTDKVDTEIPAPAAGVLSEVLVQEGTTVAINAVVARIGDSASSAAAAAAPAQAPAPPAKPAEQPKVDVGPSAMASSATESRPAPAAAPPTPAPSAAGPYPIEPPPITSQAPASVFGPGRRKRGSGAPFPTRAKDGSRVQHRPEPGQGNRSWRTHHQTGH